MNIWITVGVSILSLSCISFIAGFAIAAILASSKKSEDDEKRLLEKDINEY